MRNMSHQQKIVNYIEKLDRNTSIDGLNFTNNKDVVLIRTSKPHKKVQSCYEPSIIIVGQGNKTCYIGNKSYSYNSGQILTVFLPMPVETEITEVTSDKPFLALGLRGDVLRMAKILLKIESINDTLVSKVSDTSSGIFTNQLSESLLDTVIRLLNTLEDPIESAILSDSIIDEIYYRMLIDENNGELRNLVQKRGNFKRISNAVNHIHDNLEKQVSVEELAAIVHMSRTAFYKIFKDTMHLSPLQYAKSMKLHKAQVHLKEGKKASDAGYLVGYNSIAQFSREYRRFFGYPPSETNSLQR